MRKQRVFTFVLALAFAACMSAMALAQGITTGDKSAGQTKPAAKASTSANKTGASSMDSKFVSDAAQGGMAEVDKGNLAKSKASNDAVKQFGDKMVTDHGKANDELKSLASSKGWSLPTALPPHEKSMHTRLDKLTGAEFDKAYIRDMLRDHEKDIAEFKKCAANCSDPDLKAWAQKTLSTLESHLQMAKDAASQVGVTPSGKTSTSGAKSAKPATSTKAKGNAAVEH